MLLLGVNPFMTRAARNLAPSSPGSSTTSPGPSAPVAMVAPSASRTVIRDPSRTPL